MNLPTTITQAAPRIEQGELKPIELVNACLKRIEEFDNDLHAWVVVDAEGARAAAAKLGDEAKAGNYRGPLHGIPIGVKDIVDVQGMPTRAGSNATDPAPVAADAPVIAHLREAGAIVLGKTVTTEFAFLDPPPTRNPWNLKHTPGGSSAGSAAAVAAQMCFAAIGSQTGGSITRPASYCGVASCKPTFDTVDRTSVVAVSEHLDHVGPIARSVDDLTVMLAAMAGESAPRDPSVMTKQSAPPRLGLIEAYFLEEADEASRDATLSALKTLSAAEAKVLSRQLPESFSDVHVMHRRIMAVDAAEVHGERLVEHRDRYGHEILALVDEGAATGGDAYQAALSHQRRFADDMRTALAEVDALVTPATLSTAPASLASTGNPSFNSPWSYSGLPTVSVPCGLAADGMPLSLQLIGPAGDDARLLAVACWCEAVLAFDRLPPLVS